MARETAAALRGRARRRARRIASALLAALLLSACGPVVELELPTFAELDALAARRLAVPSVIVDADGNELAVLQREFREPVTLSQLPRHLVQAILIAEDQRFYAHGGVDARSLVRAALSNAATGEQAQGGSTITQQLVKELYMPDAPRTPETKIQEALLAHQLERELPKADILEQYLNTIYFGEGAYGVGAAAWTYFRAEVEDLDVAQSALLAAIIRAPEAFGPHNAPHEARVRRDDVLWRMGEHGYLTAEERAEAASTPIEVQRRPTLQATREPHFVDLVLRTLLDDPTFGATRAERAARLYGGGLTIHATVRPDLQELARTVLAEALDDPDDPDAAIAAIDPNTGYVLAATGSRAFDDLQFDLATQARRQPGSTFKTFVLAAAIADGWHPDDVLDGRQGTIATSTTTDWEVNNYDRRSYDAISLRAATRASVNTAYVRLGLDLGIDRVGAMARAMGVSSPVPRDAQITIGGGSLGVTPLDLASAYATLGALGTARPAIVVSHIEDQRGRTVWTPRDGSRRALSPSAAFVTVDVLRHAVETGTGRNATVDGWEVAGKTGTTSNHTDAWFAGTTTALAAAVWVGHAEGQIPLEDVQGVRQVTGGTIPAQIFSRFVTAALADAEPVPFELPASEYAVLTVDPSTGLLAAPWCPGRIERIPKAIAPTETCPEPLPAPEPDETPDGDPVDDEGLLLADDTDAEDPLDGLGAVPIDPETMEPPADAGDDPDDGADPGEPTSEDDGPDGSEPDPEDGDEEPETAGAADGSG